MGQTYYRFVQVQLVAVMVVLALQLLSQELPARLDEGDLLLFAQRLQDVLSGGSHLLVSPSGGLVVRDCTQLQTVLSQ